MVCEGEGGQQRRSYRCFLSAIILQRGNAPLWLPGDGRKFTSAVTRIIFLQVTTHCDLHHLRATHAHTHAHVVTQCYEPLYSF